MTIQDMAAKCGWETVYMPDSGQPVDGAYTSDLLSDVVAHCPDGALLITVQNHKNSIAVCTLVGSPGILIVHNRDLPEDMIAAAKMEGIALLRTTEDQFQSSCRVGHLFAQMNQ